MKAFLIRKGIRLPIPIIEVSDNPVPQEIVLPAGASGNESTEERIFHLQEYWDIAIYQEGPSDIGVQNLWGIV